MSRPAKPIDGEAMGAFLLREYVEFAKGWRTKTDLEKLALSFAPNGYPMVGNPDLLRGILRAAALPERINQQSEETRLFLVAYKRCPDFILALLTHLRKKLAAASPHRRKMLYTAGNLPNPKEILGGLQDYGGKAFGMVKAERRKIRKLVSATTKAQRKADTTGYWTRHKPGEPRK